jgi:hypothetical protein
MSKRYMGKERELCTNGVSLSFFFVYVYQTAYFCVFLQIYKMHKQNDWLQKIKIQYED